MISKEKRLNLSDYFSYKTNKIQLVFENISNPFNAVSNFNFIIKLILKHACLRTAMSFGINSVHIVQEYDNLLLNSFESKQNKANKGSIKWLNMQS